MVRWRTGMRRAELIVVANGKEVGLKEILAFVKSGVNVLKNYF